MTIDDLKSRFSSGPVDLLLLCDLDAFIFDTSQPMADRVEALRMLDVCDEIERSSYSEADVLGYCENWGL